MKLNKQKLIITNITLSLILSGCSFTLTDSNNETVENDTTIEDYNENDSEKIDKIMEFSNDNYKHLTYDYLIDGVTTTFATLIDEKTFTTDDKIFDKKQKMPIGIINDNIMQPIILPNSFILDNISNMNELSDYYGVCDITCKKLYTIDNELVYYFEGLFTFNDYSKYLIIEAKEGDTITAKCLYKVDTNGDLELIYRKQTGIKNTCKNIKDSNYNDSININILPIEETPFIEMNGNYTKEEIKEILNNYNETGKYIFLNEKDQDKNVKKK